MTMNKRVLLIGQTNGDRQPHAPHWELHIAANLTDALGIYVFHFPNVIVIDGTVPFAPDALLHLLSVEAAPIILLTDKPHCWQLPDDDAVIVLDPATDAAALVQRIHHLTAPRIAQR
jgi:hypothetical protein